MKNSLEDFIGDVIHKAQKGLGISDEELMASTGGTAATLESLGRGAQPALIQNIAKKLSLNEKALLHLGTKMPRPFALIPANILVFRTPFKVFDVNSYLLIDEGTNEAVAIDTGTDATELLKTIREQGLRLKFLLLTHAHRDHIGEVDRIVKETGTEVWIGDREPEVNANRFSAGKIFEVGCFQIETRLTSGHTPGGISYLIQETEPSVVFVGDAIFASSIGGAANAYQEALKTNQEHLFSLPNETLLFPGHGPATSVGLEKRYNPFYLGV